MKKHALNPNSVKFVNVETYTTQQKQSDQTDLNLSIIIDNYLNDDIDSDTFLDLIYNLIVTNIRNATTYINTTGGSVSDTIINDNINMIRQILNKSIRNYTINGRCINMIRIPIDNIFNNDAYKNSIYYTNIIQILDTVKDRVCC